MKRKVISVLELSEREIQLLMDLVDKAKEGQTVHYAEAETAPGQFFGVSVAESHDAGYDARNHRPKTPETAKY